MNSSDLFDKDNDSKGNDMLCSRAIPKGFIAAEAKVEVFSFSLNRWLPGFLVGLCIDAGGIPPGSACVIYEISPKRFTQKILPPSNFSSALRMVS
eukprot:s103_g15.t1